MKTLPSGESFIVRKPGNRNGNKIIAIKEHLYDLITAAHETVGHGRRDAMNHNVSNSLSIKHFFIYALLTHRLSIAQGIHVLPFEICDPCD